MNLSIENLQFYYCRFNRKYFDNSLPKEIDIKYGPLNTFYIDEETNVRMGAVLGNAYNRGSHYSITFNERVWFDDYISQIGVLLHEMNHIYEFSHFSISEIGMEVDWKNKKHFWSKHGDTFMKNKYADRIRQDGFVIEANTPAKFSIIEDT